MANPKGAPPPPPPPEPLYPTIEGLVEYATRDEVTAIFEELKGSLATLKGPKAAQSKKIQDAIASTEQLLQHLLDVRERLEQEMKATKGRR